MHGNRAVAGRLKLAQQGLDDRLREINAAAAQLARRAAESAHHEAFVAGAISPLGNDSTDFVNYWQRHWYAGVRVKQLFGHADRGGRNSYYYDTRPLAGTSPVIPPLWEAH